MRENNKYNMYNKYNQVGCDEVGYRDILKLYMLFLITKVSQVKIHKRDLT